MHAGRGDAKNAAVIFPAVGGGAAEFQQGGGGFNGPSQEYHGGNSMQAMGSQPSSAPGSSGGLGASIMSAGSPPTSPISSSMIPPPRGASSSLSAPITVFNPPNMPYDPQSLKPVGNSPTSMLIYEKAMVSVPGAVGVMPYSKAEEAGYTKAGEADLVGGLGADVSGGNTPVFGWSREKVVFWMRSWGLEERVIFLFYERNLTGHNLLLLTDTILLTTYGLQDPALRQTILSHLDQLRQSASLPATSSGSSSALNNGPRPQPSGGGGGAGAGGGNDALPPYMPTL
ncbi:hypothetical protein HDU67_008834 [Dinochytrium kinnereticum]|nr:hypothetical protein HDU67_008834 [Dinochytrium kinnereticum]